MRVTLTVLMACLFVGCAHKAEHIDGKWLPKNAQTTFVMLQPFSNVPANLLVMLKDSIPKYYPVSVNIAKQINLPLSAYYAPRNRYKADSVLVFLEKIKPGNIRLIAGITGQDISTTKGAVVDFGIMGLGFQPGNACIVSEYRLQKDQPSEKLLKQRLLKTILHEIGHNFGLSHCPNKHCIMADAEGKLNQDNETGFCDACMRKLGLR